MNKFGNTKSVGRIGATALVSVSLVFVIAHAAIGSGGPPPGPSFSITSTISSSPTSQISALLYPGVQNYLWYTAHNPQLVPITVDSMGIKNVAAPAGCAIANLEFGDTTFNGTLVVPALSSATVSVPIDLVDTNTNQDSCEGVTFNFTYSGSATFNEVYVTTTVVTSSPASPSAVGQSVTYTATVTASALAGQDSVPSGPTGTVTFLDNGSPISSCANISLSRTSTTTARARCSTFAYSSPGTHPISAEYTNTDGNFVGSSSSTLFQVIS